MMKASCTWGDGPDVLITLDGKKVLLYEDPSEFEHFTHGAVSEGSIDLTEEEARALASELLSAADQVSELNRLARDHDQNR